MVEKILAAILAPKNSNFAHFSLSVNIFRKTFVKIIIFATTKNFAKGNLLRKWNYLKLNSIHFRFRQNLAFSFHP